MFSGLARSILGQTLPVLILNLSHVDSVWPNFVEVTLYSTESISGVDCLIT